MIHIDESVDECKVPGMTHTPLNLITRDEAAVRAGVKIRTIDHWRREQKIKTYRNGAGHVRLDADEIDEFLTMKAVSA